MTATKPSLPSSFRKFGCLLVLVAIALGSMNCTAIGIGVGAGVGAVRQPEKTPSHIAIIKTERDEFGRQEPVSEPMSVGGHILVGGIAGFMLDVAAIALLTHALGKADFECDGVAHC